MGICKKNPFLLLAVIPFDQFFQIARIVRIIYLFRIKTITKYYITPYVNKMSDMWKLFILCTILGYLIVSTVIIWRMENILIEWHEALVIVFQHLFVFANSIQTIEHFPTIMLLTITSVIGVAIQGMALQLIFNKVEHLMKKRNKLIKT